MCKHTHAHARARTHTHCTRQERHAYFLSVMGWREGRWVGAEARANVCGEKCVRVREREPRERQRERNLKLLNPNVETLNRKA